MAGAARRAAPVLLLAYAQTFHAVAASLPPTITAVGMVTASLLFEIFVTLAA
jgi:hypothetical protein